MISFLITQITHVGVKHWNFPEETLTWKRHQCSCSAISAFLTLTEQCHRNWSGMEALLEKVQWRQLLLWRAAADWGKCEYIGRLQTPDVLLSTLKPHTMQHRDTETSAATAFTAQSSGRLLLSLWTRRESRRWQVSGVEVRSPDSSWKRAAGQGSLLGRPLPVGPCSGPGSQSGRCSLGKERTG